MMRGTVSGRTYLGRDVRHHSKVCQNVCAVSLHPYSLPHHNDWHFMTIQMNLNSSPPIICLSTVTLPKVFPTLQVEKFRKIMSLSLQEGKQLLEKDGFSGKYGPRIKVYTCYSLSHPQLFHSWSLFLMLFFIFFIKHNRLFMNLLCITKSGSEKW